jgi:Oxidoreductase family, NAD-binding Rossmann fold
MEPAEFVLIGGASWRAEFFLRVAQHLPGRFRCSGALVRDRAKAERFTATWGVPAYSTIDELLAATGKPVFAVVSVSRKAAPEVLADLSGRGIPCLCETPPAFDLPSLEQVNALTAREARIQVAEQYLFQPMHEARLAVVASGLLGNVSQAQVSISHGYHGISLIRHYLGIGYEPVKIRAMRFASTVVQGFDRTGPPREEQIVPKQQTLAWFDYGQKLGVFDFAAEQHRSYVRSLRLLVRGERGEINDMRVRHLHDFRTPLTFELERSDAGQDSNLEGYYHHGITGGGRWWYTNPFGTARLYDDELAVATCMAKMSAYSAGGPDFYPLAEASHDFYLSLMMDQAVASGQTVDAPPLPWAS